MWAKILNQRTTTILLIALLTSIIMIGYRTHTKQSTAKAESPIEIVYLIPENVSAVEEQLAPAQLLAEAPQPVTVTSSWQTISELASAQTLKALIIHHDAVSSVKQDELKTLFLRQALVVVGIGIPGDELARLVGLPNIYTSFDDGFEGYKTSNYFYIYSYKIDGSEDDIQKFEDQEVANQEITHPLSRSMRASTESLLIKDGNAIMWHLLNSHLDQTVDSGIESEGQIIKVECASTDRTQCK
ncbi:MAG: hypothetical protein R3C62_05230 [Chloroflexota bacterium]